MSSEEIVNSATGRTMGSLGVSADEEMVYRALLRNPLLDASAIALLGRSNQIEIESTLACLERRGLVHATADRPTRWSATPPEVAVELLLIERQTELRQARLVVPELQRELAQGSREDGRDALVILPAGSSAALQAYIAAISEARAEVALVLCPPFASSSPELMESTWTQARARGVRFRWIVASALAGIPGWIHTMQLCTDAGDDIRMLDGPPFKMLLADRRTALVPLRTGDLSSPGLRIGPSTVLDVLWQLFESLWGRAVALHSARPSSGGAKPADALIELLASGANDKTIASALGISDRTLQRRVTALCTRMQAKSRFQFGWLAAKEAMKREG